MYEFSLHLIDNPKNTIANIYYQKLELFYKNKKKSDGNYIVERQNSVAEFMINSGKGKGQEFKAKASLEESIPFDDSAFEHFNFVFFVFPKDENDKDYSIDFSKKIN